MMLSSPMSIEVDDGPLLTSEILLRNANYTDITSNSGGKSTSNVTICDRWMGGKCKSSVIVQNDKNSKDGTNRSNDSFSNDIW